jgi:uncharacterized membrane protein
MTEKNQRSDIIDLFRVTAILLMIFFHTTFDLGIFGFNQINFYEEPFWFWLPRLIVALFLTSVGASLVFTYHEHLNVRKFLKRQSKLIFLSLCVSLMTYIFFQSNWIFFGTLHCITVTSFLGIFFIKKPNLSLVLGLTIVFIMLIFKWDTSTLSHLYPIKSMDFIPPYPWMGWVWFGIYLAYRPWIKTPLNLSRLRPIINFLSRHSLGIYLIHQPILFSAIYLFSLTRKI